MGRGINPKYKKIAKERIKILFREAEKRSNYADRYMEMAVNLSKRYKVRIPKELKSKICNNCYAYLPNKSEILEENEDTVRIKCLKCQKSQTKSNIQEK